MMRGKVDGDDEQAFANAKAARAASGAACGGGIGKSGTSETATRCNAP
jgi:hypothetical protein